MIMAVCTTVLASIYKIIYIYIYKLFTMTDVYVSSNIFHTSMIFTNVPRQNSGLMLGKDVNLIKPLPALKTMNL